MPARTQEQVTILRTIVPEYNKHFVPKYGMLFLNEALARGGKMNRADAQLIDAFLAECREAFR